MKLIIEKFVHEIVNDTLLCYDFDEIGMEEEERDSFFDKRKKFLCYVMIFIKDDQWSV